MWHSGRLGGDQGGAAMANWNSGVIEEFRTNDGRVGGPFDGMDMVLVHHKGRRSGTEYINPLACLEGDDGTLYVFASKGGAPEHPDWYYNLVAAGEATVERGTGHGIEEFPVRVQEVTGAERDAIYAEQSRRRPQFAEYENKTAGIRTIPVIALRRV
jgi:deazaflavin-dependent oxidoreductase (nitroreductase family)